MERKVKIYHIVTFSNETTLQWRWTWEHATPYNLTDLETQIILLVDYLVLLFLLYCLMCGCDMWWCSLTWKSTTMPISPWTASASGKSPSSLTMETETAFRNTEWPTMTTLCSSLGRHWNTKKISHKRFIQTFFCFGVCHTKIPILKGPYFITR